MLVSVAFIFAPWTCNSSCTGQVIQSVGRGPSDYLGHVLEKVENLWRKLKVAAFSYPFRRSTMHEKQSRLTSERLFHCAEIWRTNSSHKNDTIKIYFYRLKFKPQPKPPTD